MREALLTPFFWFAQHSVLGIPLDIPAHIICGLLIYWWSRRQGIATAQALSLVMAIATLKEGFDVAMTLGHYAGSLETMKDLLFTAFGGIIGIWAIPTRRRSIKKADRFRPASINRNIH